MNLTEQLKEILYQQGAQLTGIAHMNGVENCNYPIGVAVAVSLPKKTILDLQKAPTKEYCELYDSLNNKLNEIILAGERFLKEKGYMAYAQTTTRVITDDHYSSLVPHKTVATRAGLGWIGKNCLLVTQEFGSAIRLSSLVTDAPLQCQEPVENSLCGTCRICVDKCPAQALSGTLWKTGITREHIVDVEKCYNKQVEVMKESTGIETDLCGKCFAVCAYTQRYLNRK